jgi:protein phosphatase
MRIVSGASTDTGQVRDGNEDSYLVDRRLELFAVADGMGGHRAGEIASATALDGLKLAVTEGTPVADAVGRANTAVWDKAAGDTELAGMGTTLTAAIFDEGTLTIAHVGDSRAYLLRGEQLERLTTDHSLVEELIRDGKLTEEQAAVHPQRSIITRALGVDSSVEVDVYSLVLEGGDRVILCSDGLTSMVRPAGIAEILRAEPDPTAAANALVDAANAAGGEDNITVVVLDAVAEAKDPLPSSVAAAIRPRTGAGATTGVEVVEAATVGVTTTTTSIDAPASQTAAASDPPADAAAPALPRDTARYRPAEPRRRRGRGIGRVLAFALPIIVIIGAGIAAIGWYAQQGYFVALNRGVVVVYKGRPGGVLFWDPKVVERTSLRGDRLTENDRQIVRARKTFDDKTAALAFVGRARGHASATTTTTSTTTTTTLPGTATTAPGTPTSTAPATTAP